MFNKRDRNTDFDRRGVDGVGDRSFEKFFKSESTYFLFGFFICSFGQHSSLTIDFVFFGEQSGLGQENFRGFAFVDKLQDSGICVDACFDSSFLFE